MVLCCSNYTINHMYNYSYACFALFLGPHSMYVKSLTATLNSTSTVGWCWCKLSCHLRHNKSIVIKIARACWFFWWPSFSTLVDGPNITFAKKFYLLTLTLPSKFFYIKNSTVSCGLWNKNLKFYAQQSLRDIAINFT